MDIVYYRKCAEIALRDADAVTEAEIRVIAKRVWTERNPHKRDKHAVRAWMYQWLTKKTANTTSSEGRDEMKQQFVRTEEAATEAEVEILCPWAAEIIKCEGGWQVFESVTDASIWRNQE